MITNTIQDFIRIVEWYYQTDITTCQRRFQDNVRARDAVVWLCYKYEVACDRVVGQELRIDRSSVIAARKRIANRIEPVCGRIPDKEFARDLEKLETYAYGVIA